MHILTLLFKISNLFPFFLRFHLLLTLHVSNTINLSMPTFPFFASLLLVSSLFLFHQVYGLNLLSSPCQLFFFYATRKKWTYVRILSSPQQNKSPRKRKNQMVKSKRKECKFFVVDSSSLDEWGRCKINLDKDRELYHLCHLSF